MPKGDFDERPRCSACGNRRCSCDDDINPGQRNQDEVEEDSEPTQEEIWQEEHDKIDWENTHRPRVDTELRR